MNLTETKKKGRLVYDGTVIKTYHDTVILPDGREATRDVVRHPGGVGVVALTPQNKVLLVRQYRYPYGALITEIPAGKREAGEDPVATGRRELAEETGYTADTWISLGQVYPTPGYCDEIIDLFAAKGLHSGALHTDDDEFLKPLELPFPQALELVEQGRLPDAKTQIALLRLKRLLDKGEF